jgi:hypothetical protein
MDGFVKIKLTGVQVTSIEMRSNGETSATQSSSLQFPRYRLPLQMSEDERTRIKHKKGWYCIPPPDAERELREMGHGYVPRFLLASCAGLVLQWGTAGAAIFALYKTPTVGIGCRCLTWLLYAGTSTFIWMLLVTSGFLTSCARSGNIERKEHRDRRWERCRLFIATWLSICIRRFAKVLAVLNALLVVATSLTHFGNIFKNCYCNCSVIGLGREEAYKTFWVLDVGRIKIVWVAGVASGVAISGLFLVFLTTVSEGKLQR